MSNVFPTLRREAAALKLTKEQTDKLLTDAAYDRDNDNAGHPKVFQSGRLFTCSDEGAQRLRDAAIADCLPARMKASSITYAPGPATPATAPRPSTQPVAAPPRDADAEATAMWDKVIAARGQVESDADEELTPEDIAADEHWRAVRARA